VQLLQQQIELMQQLGRSSQSDASAMIPSSENGALAAILSRQTEILDHVASAAG